MPCFLMPFVEGICFAITSYLRIHHMSYMTEWNHENTVLLALTPLKYVCVLSIELYYNAKHTDKL
jgi:hypothetical protein